MLGRNGETAVTESRIGGVLRAYGVLSAEAQKLVRAHCEKGNTQVMLEAIAEVMLAVGIASGKIPANAGMKTKDLLDRAEEAILKEAQNYNDRGGVLTAKAYASILGLAAEMAKQWLRGFAPPIPTEVEVKGTLEDPEIQDRLTVVALKLREILHEKLRPQEENHLEPEHSVYTLYAQDIEGICHRAAMEMFRAFVDPNTANHELIHKETP